MSRKFTKHYSSDVVCEDPTLGKFIAAGTTVPSDAAVGYAPGCVFIQLDGSAGTYLYVNEGTRASADFNALPTPSGGDVNLVDEVDLNLGTGTDVNMRWDTSDANANKLLLQMPAGTATNVPVLVMGQAIVDVDMGIHNGIVDPTISMIGTGAVTTGPVIELRKARGTAAAPTVVTAGDDTGIINFYNCVAAGEWVLGAQIRVDAQATLATTRGPASLTFATATDAAPSVLTDALTISKAQLVTCAAGLTVTTGTLTVSAGPVVLGEGTNPAGTVCYIGRDNTGDTTINALSGKTINFAINGSDIATLSATVLGFTGTLAATGARVTQAYFTSHTTTNAETVDCWSLTKKNIADYAKSALGVVKGIRVVEYEHKLEHDPTDRRKLGVLAETVGEPLATPHGEYQLGEELVDGPRLDMLGLVALNTKALQELAAFFEDKIAKLEAKLAKVKPEVA